MRHLRATLLLPVLILTAALAVPACGDDEGGGDAALGDDIELADRTGEPEVDVAVPDNTFEPAYMTIDVGTTVTWTNEGRNDHNVVPVVADAFEGVDAADFGPGAEHSATFDEPGDYPYYCSIHGTKNLNGQAGGIRVVGSD